MQKEFLKRVKTDNVRIQYEQANPKKFGTASWGRYERYKVAPTVARMIELGGKWADILFDYSRGYISIPDGGQYARFQLETHKMKAVYVPLQQKKQKTTANVATTTSEKLVYQAMAISPSSALSASLSGLSCLAAPAVPSSSLSSSSSSSSSSYASSHYLAPVDAWEIDEEEKNNAVARAILETNEISLLEPLDKDGNERLDAVYIHYSHGAYAKAQEALKSLMTTAFVTEHAGDDSMAKARAVTASTARRFMALVTMKMRGNEKPRGVMKHESGACGSGSTDTKKCVQMADHLPELHPGQPKRDLAKETRSELQRLELKGIWKMFDLRLKDILDDISQERASEADAALVDVQYNFKDAEEMFKLHKSSTIPSHCSLAGESAKLKRRKGGELHAMFALIESAVITDTLGAEAASKFVNRYGSQGATALAIAARAGKDPEEFVYPLLRLGADPVKAMEGAIFLGQVKSDDGWFMSLLQALHSAPPELVSPEIFSRLVRYTRATGETALIVAVGKGNTEAARKLLRWGAIVDESCDDAALRVGSQQLIALLGEYRKGVTHSHE